jgi:type IV pilus biogenesis protein CpaD/CtpE
LLKGLRFSKSPASLLVLAALALLLSGCMLVSGERTSEDTTPEAGSRNASFVSAEGEQSLALLTGAPTAAVRVVVAVAAEQGELRVEVLNPNGGVALSAASQPDDEVTRSGLATTDVAGELRYRVVARGARVGSYRILYQQQ